MSLRPNPARENVTVQSVTPLREISVYSLSGAELLKIAGEGEQPSVTLDVSRLPAGL